jgi:hypothetical protein
MFGDLHGKTRVNMQFMETLILYGKTRVKLALLPNTRKNTV